MQQRKDTTRRQFLKKGLGTGAVVAGFPTIVPSAVLGANGQTAPSNRLVVGGIGVGSRGSYILGAALDQPDTQVVAVCDVKRDRRETAVRRVDEFYGEKGCAAYNEFEAIVARDDIDAFTIGSCDHWHVLHALAATRAGKAVYVEKPLGISVAEDQALRDAVHKHKTVFQFGTQQRSDSKFRHACELVRNGRIGDLHTINVWAPASNSGGPLERTTPPETLDYDRWLGPAPAVPYTKDRETNEWWWFISDYALGFIAGWGIHPLDIALWGGGDLLEGPIDVEGTGTFPEDGLCDTATHWDVTCSYSSGVKIRFRSAPAPKEWQERYGEILSHGTAFEGTEGWVLVDRHRVQTSPSNLAESEIGPDEIRLYKSDHHMRNFIECARDGKQAICPIDTAVQSDVLCHISDIAIRLGRKLRWNPEKERFVRDHAANRRLTRSMRSPWHL